MTDRIPAIDLVRLVSLLAVLAVHIASAGICSAPDSPWLASAWQDFARNGSYGVSLFFVVSGFVITRTILRRDGEPARVDLRAFYARRAGRILPLLAAVVALGVLALPLFSPEEPRTAFCLHEPKARIDAGLFASIATFSFNWFRIARAGDAYGFGMHWDVLWSLSIEEQFYLGYPLLLRALRTRGRVVAALLGVVASGPLFRLFAARRWPDSFLLGFTSSPACFDLLALGCLLCFAVEGRERVATVARRAGLAALALAAAWAVAESYRRTTLTLAGDRVFGPTLVGLSVAAFLWAGIRLGGSSSRILAFLTYPGQLTYGGYLLHATTLFLLWPFFVGRPVLACFGVYAVATFALAAAVYRGFETPLNRRVRAALRAA